MRWVLLIAIVALFGGIAATILWVLGSANASSIAFFLGAVAFTSGFGAIIGPLGAWGTPNDEPWPKLFKRKRRRQFTGRSTPRS